MKPNKELVLRNLPFFEIVEKTVKPEGNSGRVYVPKSWVGKRVKVVLIEPLD